MSNWQTIVRKLFRRLLMTLGGLFFVMIVLAFTRLPFDWHYSLGTKSSTFTPETVNNDPYGAGWLIRVRLTDPAELDHLMDVATYRSYLAGL